MSEIKRLGAASGARSEPVGARVPQPIDAQRIGVQHNDDPGRGRIDHYSGLAADDYWESLLTSPTVLYFFRPFAAMGSPYWGP